MQGCKPEGSQPFILPGLLLIHFTVYSRSYCHLCEDMLAALDAVKPLAVFTVSVVDVDADEKLVARYDELVPVLTGRIGNGPERQLCHYFLDEGVVYAFIASERSAG
ncbi:MAG TPA: glutaredoxin family protein [Herminiimonas sp.]|nr:glutaredoxin family protein [Herminiimonas sp.]